MGRRVNYPKPRIVPFAISFAGAAEIFSSRGFLEFPGMLRLDRR